MVLKTKKPVFYLRAFKCKEIAMNFSNRPALFRRYFKFHFGFVAVAEVDPGFIGTEFFYFIQNMDPAAIDLITFLVADGPGQLNGGNAAEDLPAGAGLGADLERGSLEDFDNLIDLRHELGFLLLQLFPSFLELFEVGGVGLYRQLTRNEVVTGISVLDAHLFMRRSEVVYVLD